MEPGSAPVVDAVRDDGFTLVELLIVIVVLGILATITVFAVRGVTDQGQENACAAELRVLVTAQEAHQAEHGAYADEAGLVAAGSLASESTMYDVTVSGGEYSIVPSASSACTETVGSGGGGGGGSADPPPPAPDPVEPTTVNFGPVDGWRYAAVPSEPDEVVVFGRDVGAADFLAMIAAAPPSSRRTTFINMNDIDDDADIDAIMSRARTNGSTDFAIYTADDTSPLPRSGGGTWPSVGAYVSTQVGSDPYHQLGGTTIEDLLLSIG